MRFSPEAVVGLASLLLTASALPGADAVPVPPPTLPGGDGGEVVLPEPPPATRQFAFTGAAVTGGTGPAQATPIEPGAYTDTSRGNGKPRYYLIDKPAGGGVTVGVLARPPRSTSMSVPSMRLRLSTPDGFECNYQTTSDLRSSGQTPIISAATEFNAREAAAVAERIAVDVGDLPCMQSPQLIAQVAIEGKALEYQLTAVTVPRIENAEDLPEPLAEQATPATPLVEVSGSGAGDPIEGGATMLSAPELSPGTRYTDSLAPGQVRVYKVRLGYGQAAAFAAQVAARKPVPRKVSFVQVTTFNPFGEEYQPPQDPAGLRTEDAFTRDEPLMVTAVTDQVRVRNAEVPAQRTLAHEGFYYFALRMGTEGRKADQFEASVALRAEVTGSVDGEPEYDGQVAGYDTGAEPDAAEVPADDRVEDRGDLAKASAGVPWLPLGLGGILTLALAAAGLAWRRRRSAKPTA